MFTTKTEYGLKALVRLAKNKDKKPISLAQIAKEEHISQSYLEQIFFKLKANDLVIASKGSEGGYFLSRPASKINVFEIVEALEGPLAVFYCMAKENKKIGCNIKSCLTRQIWDELQKNIIKTLRKFKLKDLI